MVRMLHSAPPKRARVSLPGSTRTSWLYQACSMSWPPRPTSGQSGAGFVGAVGQLMAVLAESGGGACGEALIARPLVTLPFRYAANLLLDSSSLAAWTQKLVSVGSDWAGPAATNMRP